MLATLRQISVLVLILSAVFAHTATCRAGTITFPNQTRDVNGSGFGNVLTVLAVHANKTESGSVLWNGASDVTTDDATNQSQTRTIAELLADGITSAAEIGLVLNIAEPGNGPDLTVFDFTMRFTDSAGVPLFADVNYTAPGGGLSLLQVAAGVGGAGWLFEVNLSPAEEALAFGSSSNRIAMIITTVNAFALTGGGPDSFFITKVPEPSSIALLGLGCLVMFWRSRVVRR